MPSHSEGPGIWLSVWRFLLAHCLYERAAKVLARLCGCAGSPEPSLLAYVISTKFAWRGPNRDKSELVFQFIRQIRIRHCRMGPRMRVNPFGITHSNFCKEIITRFPLNDEWTLPIARIVGSVRWKWFNTVKHNSVDPCQMRHSASSDQGLHCLF